MHKSSKRRTGFYLRDSFVSNPSYLHWDRSRDVLIKQFDEYNFDIIPSPVDYGHGMHDHRAVPTDFIVVPYSFLPECNNSNIKTDNGYCIEGMSRSAMTLLKHAIMVDKKFVYFVHNSSSGGCKLMGTKIDYLDVSNINIETGEIFLEYIIPRNEESRSGYHDVLDHARFMFDNCSRFQTDENLFNEEILII